MTDHEAQFITHAKLLSAVAAVLLIVAGWIFSLVIHTQIAMRDKQEILAERVSHLEARMEILLENPRPGDQ